MDVNIVVSRDSDYIVIVVTGDIVVAIPRDSNIIVTVVAVNVVVVVPRDNDCIGTVSALRRGVSDALALRSPRRHRSPLGARGRKTLL